MLYSFDDDNSEIKVYEGVINDGTKFQFVNGAFPEHIKYNLNKDLEIKLLDLYSAVVHNISKELSMTDDDMVYLILPDWFCIFELENIAEPLIGGPKIIIFPETLFLMNDEAKSGCWEGLNLKINKIISDENGSKRLICVLEKDSKIKPDNKFLKSKLSSIFNNHRPFGYCVEQKVDYFISINDTVYKNINGHDLDITVEQVGYFDIHEYLHNGPVMNRIYNFNSNNLPVGWHLDVVELNKNNMKNQNIQLDMTFKKSSNKAYLNILHSESKLFSKKFNLRDTICFGVKIYG